MTLAFVSFRRQSSTRLRTFFMCSSRSRRGNTKFSSTSRNPSGSVTVEGQLPGPFSGNPVAEKIAVVILVPVDPAPFVVSFFVAIIISTLLCSAPNKRPQRWFVFALSLLHITCQYMHTIKSSTYENHYQAIRQDLSRTFVLIVSFRMVSCSTKMSGEEKNVEFWLTLGLVVVELGHQVSLPWTPN